MPAAAALASPEPSDATIRRPERFRRSSGASQGFEIFRPINFEELTRVGLDRLPGETIQERTATFVAAERVQRRKDPAVEEHRVAPPTPSDRSDDRW